MSYCLESRTRPPLLYQSYSCAGRISELDGPGDRPDVKNIVPALAMRLTVVGFTYIPQGGRPADLADGRGFVEVWRIVAPAVPVSELLHVQ